MVKTKTIFVCQQCAAESPRWIGKCPQCDAWNSYVEEQQTHVAPSEKLRVKVSAVQKSAPVLLKDVAEIDQRRLLTQIDEFDRVMGGGVVPGSVTLIGGDPGIGKSTIVMQAGTALAKLGLKILYVSGEESIAQAKMRATRVASETSDQFFIVGEIDVSVITGYIQQLAPDVVIIDSIQVVHVPEITSSPGSVAQVRESAAILTHLAKSRGFALFFVGHVTKEGSLAGPRVLEHLVDTVLYFEGERYSSYRILRANKNRFGSTNEIGVFEMTQEGLMQVLNPSQILLAQRPQDTSGSVVVPTLEGTRPLLVEIQGLVARSTYGMVRHKAQGFDANRLSLLVAVLDKRLGLHVGDKDIFLNVVGGVKVVDPAADLGVCVAMASSLLDKPIGAHTIMLGEVGLSAEVRSVSQLEIRLNEAAKLGFTKAIIPKNNGYKPRQKSPLTVVPVMHVKEALDKM